MKTNRNILSLIVLFSSFTIGTQITLATDFKSCKHNGIMFDVIRVEADCFLDANGDLNEKMLAHHDTGLLETGNGTVYSEKIHNHFNPIRITESLDIYDPDCIPSEALIILGENTGK